MKFTELIKDVADFPKPGIVFKDITPMLENAQAFAEMVETFCGSVKEEFDVIAAIESRGFIIGSAMAHKMGKGLVLVRKPGKLPREVEGESYDLEYGTDRLEVHKSSITPGLRVLIIDDVLATGGTAAAAERLCKKLGAEVVGHRFLMELGFLEGSQKLTSPHQSLMVI